MKKFALIAVLLASCANPQEQVVEPKKNTVATVIEVIRERFPESVYLTDSDLVELVLTTCQGLEDGVPVRELQQLSKSEKVGLTEKEIEMFETVFVLSIATVCTKSLI